MIRILAVSLVLILSASARADDSPACLTRSDGQSNEAITKNAHLSETEILARLVFAEGISTNFEKFCADEGPQILQGIAWGVMSRVRLGEKSAGLKRLYGDGVSGVIFNAGQFNPAVSKTSRFSELFLCPSKYPGWKEIWNTSMKAAQMASAPGAKSPFLGGTPNDWEARNQTSLVNQFYYPRSEQATPKPPAWADITSKSFVKNISIGGKSLSDRCIWFFKNQPPPPTGGTISRPTQPTGGKP